MSDLKTLEDAHGRAPAKKTAAPPVIKFRGQYDKLMTLRYHHPYPPAFTLCINYAVNPLGDFLLIGVIAKKWLSPEKRIMLGVMGKA